MRRDWKKDKFVVFTCEDLVMWRQWVQQGVQQGVGLGGSRVWEEAGVNRTWPLSPSSDCRTPEQLGIRSGGVWFILSHSVLSVVPTPPSHCPSSQHNATQPL